MSKLQEKLSNGGFAITCEVGPPKGTNVDKCLDEAEHFKDRVDAVNVTDLQSAAMRFGSLASCHLLKDRGIEPVLQMVCRDRNRLALQSDLLSAYRLGIENVLCLTGDHNILGDDPDSMPVFDLDSVSLLYAASELQKGRDLAGNELEEAPNFFLGAVVTPGADPLEPQLIKMEKKIEAGAQFFQTQTCYDPEVLARFMEAVKPLNTKVLAGIVVLKSVGMARYMNANVAGVTVPEHLVDELKRDKEKTRSGRTGIEITARLCREFKNLCDGIHLMPLGWDDKVPEILDMAEL